VHFVVQKSVVRRSDHNVSQDMLTAVFVIFIMNGQGLDRPDGLM
jgi:hypothetical protein